MQPYDFPRNSTIIDRPRLMAQLQAALQGRLTLIIAPPGYGKTTLVAQLVVNSSYTVAWHTVEERHRDLPILHTEALNALSYVFPQIKDLVVPEGYSPTELVTLLADYIRERTTDDILYVIEDVHQLAKAPAAENWLQALVTILPENCHFVFISRTIPSLRLADIMGRWGVQAISETDLSFTFDEVREIGQLIRGESVPEDEIQELLKRHTGWPVGTVLALQPNPAGVAQTGLSGSLGPEQAFDLLAKNILTAQLPEIQDFLLTSSTLTRLSPGTLSSALGITNARNWLAKIQALNLLVVGVPGGMSYHVLFRNFLQNQLRQRDSERFALLHRNAAVWYEGQDQLDSALDHYLLAEQIEQASAIAARASHSFFVQGKLETLLSWNTRLRAVGASIPPLSYRCAMIYSDRYDYEAAQACLMEAQNLLSVSDSQPSLADIEIQRAVIRLQQGTYQEAADRVIQFIDYPTSPDNIRGRALRILGYAQLRLGNIELAAAYLEEALPLHRASDDNYALSNVLQDLGVVYARLGHLDDALGCLQEVIALRRSLGNIEQLAHALNNLGCYCHRGGDYERAANTLEEGLSITTRFPNRRAEAVLRWSLGDLRRDCGNFYEAEQLYNKALEVTGSGEPALRAEILISQSTLYRWRGNLADALSAAIDAETHIPQQF